MGREGGEPGRPEGPVRRVEIPRPFAIGRHEVTVTEYQSFVDATGRQSGAGCRVHLSEAGQARSVFNVDPNASWRRPGVGSTSDPARQPVVCVSHADASAYVTWLAELTRMPYRLPSEAEWEYAARAGATGDAPWSGGPDTACEHANLYDAGAVDALGFGWAAADCDDGAAELAPVGRYRANAFGLHDMLGNAWEWVADCYAEGYEGAPTDGSAAMPVPGACARRSVRGGGWLTRPDRVSFAFRGRDPPDARYNYFGLRVARDLTP